MSWDIPERFPPWGETGENPSAGFFYEGGDQVNEKHLDALWNNIQNLEADIRSALSDIDSDQDGVVDEADNANAYKGNDIDSNGDGVVDEADNASLVKQTDLDTDYVNAEDSGLVHTGDAGLLYVTELADTQTLDVYHASLTADGDGAPSGTSMRIVTLDGNGGGTDRQVVLSGDGSLLAGQTGSPLASWQNTTGTPQTVAIVLDNGHFGSGSGSDTPLSGSVTARVN